MQGKKKRRRGMSKRMTALLLVCCMVLSGNIMTIFAEEAVTGIDNVVGSEESKEAAPQSRQAAAATGEGTGNTTQFAGGTGTMEDPFLVKTAAHLQNLRSYGGKHMRFKQIADIDLKGVTINDYVITSFGINGGYDGGGYIIENFTLQHGTYGWPGFMGNGSGTISNMVFVNPLIQGGNQKDSHHKIGVIAGSMASGKITNCAIVDGTINLPNRGGNVHTAGMIVGYPCENTEITNCLAIGNIVDENTAADNPNNPSYLGGIGGEARNRVKIENCYFSGSITSANPNSRIASGGIKYNPSYGTADAMTMENCYYNSDLLKNTTDYDYEYHTTPKTTEEMKSQAFTDLMGTSFIRVPGETARLAIMARMFQGPHLMVTYPERIVKTEGESLKLSVEVVENNYSPTFQWYRDGVAISGATEKTINISSLDRKERGSYQCKVDNKMAFTISPACWVQVWRGKGSDAYPYQTEDQKDLEMIQYDLSGKYMQVRDIKLDDSIFLSIGEGRGQFTGLYDGGGREITNLSIMGGNASGSVLTVIQEDAGLFSTVGSGGIVRNLGVSGDLNSSRNYLGLVAGVNNGTIENCYSYGKVHSYRMETVHCGGIAGLNGAGGVIKNCFSKADISTTRADSSIGGVSGLTNSTGKITNSYFAGTLTSAGTKIGGVSCVEASSNIDLNSTYYKSDCSTQTITSGTGTSAVASDLMSSGTILAKLGDAFYRVSGDYPALWTSDRNAASGFIYDPVGNEVLWASKEKELILMADVVNGKIGSTYTWYRDDIMIQTVSAEAPYGERGNYPDGIQPELLIIKGAEEAIGSYHCVITKTYNGKNFKYTSPKVQVKAWEGGSGTQEDPYLVGGPKQFMQVRENLTAHYKQIRDIDMSQITNYEPTGTAGAPFQGYYCGDGYMLINLNITGKGDGTGAGVFGTVQNGSVTELGCKNVNIASNAQAVGAIAGVAKSGARLDYCYVNSGTISNTGTSTANNAAAAAGTTVVSAGGIVGTMETGAVMTYSYNRGDVKNSFIGGAAEGKSGAAGGIAGYAPSNAIERVYFSGKVTGGLDVLRTSVSNSGSITAGFYDTEKQGSVAVNNPSAVVGKTTDELQAYAILDLLGKDKWVLYIQYDYPSLVFRSRLMTLQEEYPRDTGTMEQEGAEVFFEVKIDQRGVPDRYTYEWYKEGQNNPVKTTYAEDSSGDVLRLPLENETGIWGYDAGKYYCVVSNGIGAVESRRATLHVEPQNGAPKFTAIKSNGDLLQNAGWANDTVTVEIDAMKNNSRPTSIEYKIGKTTQSYTSYAGKFPVSEEGGNQILARAQYADGTVVESSFLVNIDKTPPSCGTYNIESQTGKSNSRKITLKYLSDGNGSGVAAVSVIPDKNQPSISDERWKALNGSESECEYEIFESSSKFYIWVIDNAENISKSMSTGSITNVFPEIKQAELYYDDIEIGASATAKFIYNGRKELETEAKSVVFEQLDGENIATISSEGTATAKLVGEARVKATLTNYNGNVVETEGVVNVVNTPPLITENPTDQGVKKTDAASSTFTYTVKATGTNNAYRWYYIDKGSEQAIQVQNNSGGHVITTSHTGNSGFSTLKITAPPPGYADRVYYAMVGNDGNTAVTSNKASLFLYEDVHVVTNPAETTVTVGKEAQFSITADSTSPSTKYQWQVSKDRGGTWAAVPAVQGGDDQKNGTASSYTTEKTTAEMNTWYYRCMVSNAGYPSGNFSSAAKLNVRTAPEKPVIRLLADSEGKYFNSGQWNDEQYKFSLSANGTVAGDTRLQYQIVTITSSDNMTTAASKLLNTIDDTKNGVGAWTTAVQGAEQTVTQPTGTKVMVFARAINEWVYQNEKPDGSAAATQPGGRVLMQDGVAAVKYNSFEAWYDGTGATGKIKFGTPEKIYDSLIKETQFNLFYKDSLAVEVTGEDKESGISKIYYTWFNGKNQTAKTTEQLSALADNMTATAAEGKWNAYGPGTFDVNAADEGARVIYAKIINNAGTVTYISSEGFIMDSTPPVIAEITDSSYKMADGKTNISFVTGNGGKWTAEKSMKLQLGISDQNAENSGVDKWRSTFSKNELSSSKLTSMKSQGADWISLAGGTGWNAYSSTAADNQIEITENGFVYVQAIDKAGNTTEINKVAITQFDHTAPDFTIEASNVKNAVEEWTNQNVTLSVKDAADGESGLSATAYWFTGFTDGVYTADSGKAYSQNGIYTVKVRDLVGNTTTKSCEIGKIDKTIPEIADEPALTDATYNNEWISGTAANVTVSVTGVSDKGDTIDKAEQPASDVKGVYVQASESGTAETTSLTYADGAYSTAISNPGVTTKYWLKAKDNAGNWSAAKAFIIKVDKIAPLIENITVSSEKTDNRYSVSFTAGDYQDADKLEAGSGVERVYYAKKSDIDENTLLTDTTKYTEIAADKGTYTFKTPENVDYIIRAVDNVGNKTNIIDVYARHAEVAASVPTQMMFAVIPNAAESFVSPDYRFTNLSAADNLEVSAEKAVTKKMSGLVLGNTDAEIGGNIIRLYADKTLQSEGFAGLQDAIIYETSENATGCKTRFGTLEKTKSGSIRLKAETFGYSAADKTLLKRGSWSLLLNLKAEKGN